MEIRPICLITAPGHPANAGDDYPYASTLKRARNSVRSRLVLSKNEHLWRSTRWLGRRALSLAQHFKQPRPVGGTGSGEIFSGCWYGNDTAWRMVLDLNRVLFLADSEGVLQRPRPRPYLSIVDAIVGGEGQGPLEPTRRPLGVVLAGLSPVATDWAAAHCMGFDANRIPLLRCAVEQLGIGFPNADGAGVIVNTRQGEHPLARFDVNWHFCPPNGWIGHIERDVESGTDDDEVRFSSAPDALLRGG